MQGEKETREGIFLNSCYRSVPIIGEYKDNSVLARVAATEA